jgi:hypothetical protein
LPLYDIVIYLQKKKNKKLGFLFLGFLFLGFLFLGFLFFINYKIYKLYN